MGKRIDLDENLVIQKYKELNNVIKVGKLFGVSFSPICRVLRKHGIKFQTRKNFVNETYFDVIDSEEKAYWLGFLSADGYIRVRKQGDTLGIKLSQLDTPHLELLKKCLNSDHKLTFGTSQTKDKKGRICESKLVTLSVFSNRLVKSIMSQGFHERKTYTIDKPTIDKKYYRHYIRGFFDGDGCCHLIRRNERLYVSYSMACASPKLKEFFIEELRNNSIDFRHLDKLSIGTHNSKNVYKFYKYMYDDSSIYLQRKKDKGYEFMEYYMINREKGNIFFQEDYTPIDETWTEDDINIIKKYHNKIPLSYLHHSLLKNKSIQQIYRYCRKHGIKNDRRISRKGYEEFCKINNIVPYSK